MIELTSAAESPNIFRTVYVMKGGNDTSGNWSILRPFLTIAKAISIITPPYGQDYHWVIRVGPGRFIETLDICLPPYVDLIGDGHRSTYVRVNGDEFEVCPSEDWATTSSWTTIAHMYLGGATKINFDLRSIGGQNSNIVLQDIWANTDVELIGRGAGGGDFLECYDTLFLGPVTLDQMFTQWQGGVFVGTLTINNTAGTCSETFINCSINGDVVINGSYVTDTQFSACPFATATNTITTTGTVNLLVDNLSMPPISRQTLSVGTVVTYANDATTLKYNPYVSANWTSVPDQVSQALDVLASNVFDQIAVDTTLNTSHHKVEVTAACTITLPSAAGISGREYIIKRTNAIGEVTIMTTSSQTIDGSTNLVLSNQYDWVSLTSNGSDWIII